MKKAIIVGATSGIGKELAFEFSQNGFEVGIAGRRATFLAKIANALPNKSFSAVIDIKQQEDAINRVAKLIEDHGCPKKILGVALESL